MGLPMVTAIITTHNRMELLLKAIESVINQTYKNIEIIVVDDGSDENIEDILKKIYSEKIRYIYIPKSESKGGNYARNIGICNANGTYVAFLDDDDEWFKDKIVKQINYLESKSDCMLVACGRLFEIDNTSYVKEDCSSLISGDVFLDIWKCIPFTTSSLMLRKDALVEVGMFDEKLKFWQEYELQIRFSEISKFGVIRENLVLYRIISSDNDRLSNRYDGWREAVNYIHVKYKERIMNLDAKTINKHKAMVELDGATRAKRANMKMEKRLCLFKNFYLDPSVKNFIKFLIGEPNINLWWGRLVG